MTEHEDILVGGTVKDKCGYSHKRVEPATSLVHTLGDEVCGEMAFKVFLVFKGIVVLGIGHGARFKPAVQNLWNASHGTTALARNSDFVYKVLVQVFWVDTGKLLQLLATSHTMGFATVGTLPHRNGISPVAVTANGPVTSTFQPLTNATVFDVVRLPSNFLVGGYHLVANVLYLYEPAANGTVNQGAGTTPAEGIGVENLVSFYQLSFLLEAVDDVLVAVLYEAALVLRHLVGKLTLIVDGAHGGYTCSLEYLVVVFTKARGGVNDTSSVLCGNEVSV